MADDSSQIDAEPSVQIDNSSRKEEPIRGPWGTKPEIAASMLAANNKRLRHPINFFIILTILLLVIGIILIIIFSQIDEAGLLVGGLVCLTFFIIMGCSLPCCYWTRRAENMDKEEHYAIRLEGDQWERYLTYFFEKDNRPKNFYWCMKSPEKRIDELRERAFGHIIIGSSGFMIDEIYYTSYGMFAVLNAERLTITNEDGVRDPAIRVSLTYRNHQAKHGAMVFFHVDIFVPSEMSDEELTNIMHFISLKRGDVTLFV